MDATRQHVRTWGYRHVWRWTHAVKRIMYYLKQLSMWTYQLFRKATAVTLLRRQLTEDSW